MSSRTSKPKLNRQIVDEASEWFVEFRVGDAQPAQRERFDQWLRQSPDHIRAYMEIARLYADLPALDAAGAVDIQKLTDAARRASSNVVSLDATRSTSKRAQESVTRPVGSRTRWAVAASLAAVAFALIVAAWIVPGRGETYATQIGERRLITLSDGSTIDLNARSKLRVHMGADKREIELIAGRALFEVAKDKARPFIVRSDNAIVQAVGTQFDVNRTRSGTTVTVLEGRVSVDQASSAQPSISASSRNNEVAGVSHGAAATVFLDAGERITVSDVLPAKVQRVSPSIAAAWAQHRVVFDGSSLADVVEEFNRYNARQLVIADPRVEAIPISGVYSSTDPSSFIMWLRSQPGVDIVETDTEVRISHK